MSMMLKEKYEEPVFMPYKFRFGVGDCADSTSAKNVSQIHYGNQSSFVLAGRTLVRHAP